MNIFVFGLAFLAIALNSNAFASCSFVFSEGRDLHPKIDSKLIEERMRTIGIANVRVVVGINESEDDKRDPILAIREIIPECPMIADIGFGARDLTLDRAEKLLQASCALEHSLNYLRQYRIQYNYENNPEKALIRTNLIAGRQEFENPMIGEVQLRKDIESMMKDINSPSGFNDIFALILKYADSGYPLPVQVRETIQLLKE